MKQIKLHGFGALIISLLVSCAANRGRKGAAYYYENQKTITEIRQLYEDLYKHQPFSAGFSDKSFKYYLLEVTSDTVRYIYNTEQSRQQVFSTLLHFNYDTVRMKALGEKMKSIKSLWLSKSSFYVDENRETVTFLSFKSIASSSPFVENKYYILVFLQHPATGEGMKAKIKKGGFVKINDLVYFTIGSGFR